MIMDRTPVVEVLYAAWAFANPPWNWQQIPAMYFGIEDPIVGVYGSVTPGSSGGSTSPFITMAPGFVTNFWGRGSTRIRLYYVNGWPHCGTTSTVAAGAQAIPVDDVTGATGATMRLFDGGNTETVFVSTVTATTSYGLPDGTTAPAGPGVLNLAQPLLYGHSSGLVVSSLPDSVMLATIYYATADALTRGAATIDLQSMSGTDAGTKDTVALLARAEELLDPFRRII